MRKPSSVTFLAKNDFKALQQDLYIDKLTFPKVRTCGFGFPNVMDFRWLRHLAKLQTIDQEIITKTEYGPNNFHYIVDMNDCNSYSN